MTANDDFQIALFLLGAALLIANPFAPKKFLKQCGAFLRQHTAPDVATMI